VIVSSSLGVLATFVFLRALRRLSPASVRREKLTREE
jgi:hypothetical protein